MAAAAFEDALRHYESALSLQPTDDRRGRADLLYKRGLARRSLGRSEETLADWREALAAYDELGDAEAVGRICHEMSVQFIWAARPEEAMETARHGLMALGERVTVDRCRLLAWAGITLSMAGYYTAADGMLSQAVAIAEQLGDQRLLGTVLVGKAFNHCFHMQMPETVDSGLRAAELLRSVGDLWELARVLWGTQFALLILGRLDEVAEIGDELEPLATRLGHLGALMNAGRASAAHEFMLAPDLDRFQEFAQRDLELCHSAAMPWIANSYTMLGLARFWKDRSQEALKNFEQATELEPAGAFAGADWVSLFLWKSYAGDKDAALAMLNQRRDNLPRPGQPNTNGAWTMLFGVVEGLALLGERDEAAKLYPLVLEAIDTGALVRLWTWGLLQTVAGMAAAAGGQWEKAEEHYQTALRQAHELPVVVEQAEVRRWYARMLIDRDAPGDRDRARELLGEAIEGYRRIGMPKHVEMAEALLGEL